MIRRGFLAITLILFGATFASAVIPTAVASAEGCPGGKILTLKPWYDGLQNGDCTIKPPSGSQDEQRKFVLRIILNIVDDLLQVIGYIAVGFVIYGGFIFMTHSDSPEGIKKARDTIIQALIGLVVAMMSVGIVNLIARALL